MQKRTGRILVPLAPLVGVFLILIACPKWVPPNAPVPCFDQEMACDLECGGPDAVQSFECSQTGGLGRLRMP